jgi:hypothetical protein
VNVDANGDGSVNIAVEHFTDFALLAAPGSTISLPLIAN